MMFNVLLFKIENYQQINNIESALLTNVNGIIICTSTQGFRKATCVKKTTTETKHPQLGLLYSVKHFAMYYANATTD